MPKRMKPVMAEERKIERVARRTARDLAAEMLRGGNTPYELMQAAELIQQNAHGNVDFGYIKTLLFPELYNADIPQPMSTQSYCRFTDKKEFTISSQGSGMLLFYPKVNVGPSVFIRYVPSGGSLNAPLPFQIGSSLWRPGGWQDYNPYFAQTALVAASIQIQYTGQLQLEQGYMVGSQIYGISPSQVVLQDIENGQFRCMTKPGDGMRQVYVPKDMNDFGYYGCGYNVTQNGTTITGQVRTRNGGKNPDGDMLGITYPTTAASAGVYIEGVVPTPVSAGKYGIGTDTNTTGFLYQAEADFIAIYWTGLNASAAGDLRVDITRKFNGFPHAQERDILDVQKPKRIFDAKKTIDVISELQSAVPQIAGHALKQMDRISDQIQELLPNLGHLYNEGALKEGTTLEGFAQQLQAASGMGGVGGPLVTGRLYE